MGDIERLEHLRDELVRLRDIADAEGLTTLRYLLLMAIHEASTAVAVRRRPPSSARKVDVPQS